ncbi:MAG TPA: heme o synthase [Acidobacteriaceae bacterium]|jgi:protoheme IX farnesyltransferase|nr:heme o synthase [Acidobacteriaceae bacterium]
MTPIAQVETGANASVAAAAPATTVAAAPATTTANSGSHTLLSDLNQLFKTRVSLMVVITAWAGFYLGSVYSRISSLNLGLLQALIGVALVSCGASALNEAMERTSDRRMLRTAQRPLASGRMPLPVGIALGLAPVVAGAFCLARFTNLLTVALALLTVFTYVAIYTPLKRHTTLATFIGAFPGAMPPLLGWTAARGRIEWPAVVLFAILFVWQFPHFMAIAWLYRDDYARAGIKMLPVVEPDGSSTVLEALLYAILLIPVSLAPVYLHMTGYIYGAIALLLGIFYLGYTIRFARITRVPRGAESRRYAHDLLRVSIIYLPLLLAALMFNAKGGR